MSEMETWAQAGLHASYIILCILADLKMAERC